MESTPEILTKGILVKNAIHFMWSVKTGGRIYASSSIKNLKKHMFDPEAEPGVMARVTYVEQRAINSSKKTTFNIHVELNDGAFVKQGGRIPNKDWKFNHFSAESFDDPIQQRIATLVVEKMLKRWQTKFRREAKL